MLKYFISVIPIFIYLSLLIYLDSFSLVKKGRLICSFMWGVCVCLFVYVLIYFLGDNPHFSFLENAGPVTEEILKYIFVVFFFITNRMSFFSDSTTYGGSVGAGFAFTENIIYIILNPDINSSELVYRGLATSIMHMGVTAIAAAVLLSLTNSVNIERKKAETIKLLFIPLALIPSIILHSLHNQFYVNPAISFVVVIAVVMLIFLLLHQINEYYIHEMLDMSIYNEVALMSAIKKGEFGNTEAGKYLLSMKNNFNPEVYFDMMICVELALSLSLKTKSVLMRREAEIEVPRDEIETIKKGYIELSALKKNIGKTGVSTIKPIIGKHTFKKSLL